MTNLFGLVGGRDAETDDDYRFRLNLKVQSSAGANEAALRLELLEIPGIQDPDRPGRGPRLGGVSQSNSHSAILRGLAIAHEKGRSGFTAQSLKPLKP